MGKYDDRPYEVGKGKPPKKHRFPPGQSGNPLGPKRKTRKALREQLIKAGNQVIHVPTPQGIRKMTRNELGIELLYDDLLQGSRAERLRAFKELRVHGAFDTLPEDHKIPAKQMERFIERLQEEARRMGEWDPAHSQPAPTTKK